LYHDIAKGRKGDHSDLGAKEAIKFCKDHGLGDYDTKMVAWLVNNHLLMSKTSQKEDINDPDVVSNFATKVADQNHLNHLYLLTVADICATNPELWNSWKASLLSDLYHNTLHVLRRGLEKPLHKQKRLQQIKQDSLALLAKDKFDETAINKLWKTLNADYFFRHSPEEITWQTSAILNVEKDQLPLILVDKKTAKGWSVIFVYTKDAAGIFSATTRAIEKLRMNILDARIITSRTGYTLDSYIVLEEDGKPVKNKQRCDEIILKITNELQNNRKITPLPKSIVLEDRKLRSFKIPTRVHFTLDKKNNRTIMEVITMDRPGVLSRIGVAMELCGARLQGAKITTYGEKVEDIFYITDKDNILIDDPLKFECLESSIKDALR